MLCCLGMSNNNWVGKGINLLLGKMKYVSNRTTVYGGEESLVKGKKVSQNTCGPNMGHIWCRGVGGLHFLYVTENNKKLLFERSDIVSFSCSPGTILKSYWVS